MVRAVLLIAGLVRAAPFLLLLLLRQTAGCECELNSDGMQRCAAAEQESLQPRHVDLKLPKIRATSSNTSILHAIRVKRPARLG
jgi:hypothetical protein